MGIEPEKDDRQSSLVGNAYRSQGTIKDETDVGAWYGVRYNSPSPTRSIRTHLHPSHKHGFKTRPTLDL